MIDKDMLEAIGQLLEPILKEQREIRDDLQSLKADVAQIPVMKDQIGILLDGMSGMNEKFAKLDTVAEDVEEIKLTVRAMEAVTQRNSNDIQKLRAVK
ncbi:MAG: hypothetical protein ACLSS9_15720 [Acutalibacteraceae bacterium]